MTKLAKTNLISLTNESSALPRPDIIQFNLANMTDEELVEVSLGKRVGKDTHTVVEMLNRGNFIVSRTDSARILQEMNSILKIETSEIKKFLAGMEFASRRLAPRGTKIREPRDILPYLTYLSDSRQEHLLCASLNGAHEILNIRVVTIGLANMTQVHPREVFADPITDRACAIIIAHNHPSGDLTPSFDDKSVTKRIEDAGKLLGIRLLDHIIFSSRGHYSFGAEGLLSQN